MYRLAIVLCAAAASLLAEDFAVQSGGEAPAGLDASVVSLLEKSSTKVTKGGQPFLELWFRTQLPKGPETSENNLTMPNVPHGALLAVLKVEQTYADRRGQTIKPGLYTMRYSYIPENGTHQGAATQRDFLLLVPAAGDTKGESLPSFDDLLVLSRKASGTPHPAVFSFWKEDPQLFKPNTIEKQGEHDYVLMRKVGGVNVALILLGQAEA